MSNVTLSIGGRSFTVAAADGEESHIEMLGRMIDERARRMGGTGGHSEPRMLLFAALLLADELHEAHDRAPPPPPVAPPPPAPDPRLVARIEAIAQNIENLAEHLERQAIEP